MASFRYDHSIEYGTCDYGRCFIESGSAQCHSSPGISACREDGQIRAELKSRGSNNTQLRLYDGSGKSEVSIAANEQRAIVNLKHDQRTNRAVIEAHNLGAEVALSKENEKGKVLAHIVGGAEGTFVKLKPITVVKLVFQKQSSHVTKRWTAAALAAAFSMDN